MKKFCSGILLVLLLICSLTIAFNIQEVKVNANSSGQPWQAGDAGAWFMFHQNWNHTGNSSSTAPHTNQTLWTYHTGGAVYSSPAVANGTLYVGSNDDRVYALNAATGKQIWNYTTHGSVESSPAVANGVVYVGSLDGNVYALNATKGAKEWNYTTGGAVYSSPTVANTTGTLYIGSNDDKVYALNATTGTLVWKYPTGGAVYSSPAVVKIGVNTTVVYVGSRDGEVYALNAVTGALKWKYAAGLAVNSSPAVAEGKVFVASENGSVYALNATTGKQIWNFPPPNGEGVDSSPAFDVVDNRVFFGSEDNRIYAVDATTGKQIWSTGVTGGMVESSPAVAHDVVFVGSDGGSVYALSASAATATQVWKYKTPAPVFSSPAVAEGEVFVGSENDNVYAFLTLQVSIAPYPSVYMDVGQNQTFTASVSGGTPRYSYQWYLDGTKVGTNSSTWTYASSAAVVELHTVYVNVTDHFGFTRNSQDALAYVASPLSVRILPRSVALIPGQTHVFTPSVSGGTPPYTYQWYLDGVPIGTGSSWNYTPSSTDPPNPHNVTLSVTDSATVRVSRSATVWVQVNPYGLDITPDSVNVDFNQSRSQTFTATVYNGSSPYVCFKPYIYKWFLNGKLNYTENTSSTVSIWNFSSLNPIGNYSVWVTVNSGLKGNFAKSNTAFITVNPPLSSVTISPSKETTELFSVPSPTFTCTSISYGTPPPTYQWYLNGTPVTGATDPTWTFTPIYAGFYRIYLNVTDSAEIWAISNTASLTVYPRLGAFPAISPYPKVVLDVGQSQIFTASVSGGTPPYSYQWYLDYNRQSDANEATWSYTPSQPSVGSLPVYYIVTDAQGYGAKSNTTWITVYETLSVTISPSYVVLDVGQNQAFTATPSGGTGNFSYQWYLNGTSFPGATNSTWTFSPPSNGSDTVYVNVTDIGTKPSALSVRSLNSSVGVNPQLAITISPRGSVTIYSSQNQTFISSVSGGNSPYSYQWYENGTAVSGANSSTWLFPPSSVGLYNVFFKVTDNESQIAYSNNASLIVIAAPSFNVTITPTAKAIDLGGSVYFRSTTNGGTQPYHYQWYLNGSLYPGADSSNWNFTPPSVAYYTVYVEVNDSSTPIQQTASNTAFVTVNSPPHITIYPTNSTIHGKSQIFISIISGGTSPYAYQWYENGSLHSGATNSSWLFNPSSAGTYTVYVNVTDSAGVQKISNNATVTVIWHHDVAVTNITLSKTVIGQGFAPTLGVKVSNTGDYTETFKVSAFANGTLVGPSQNVTLFSGNSATITLTWNTAGFAHGNYTISANVTLAMGETNSESSVFTLAGAREVTIPGDVNGDGVVNILDVAQIAAHWGQVVPISAPPDLANADVNCDGIVNILDVSVCAANWGSYIK